MRSRSLIIFIALIGVLVLVGALVLMGDREETEDGITLSPTPNITENLSPTQINGEGRSPTTTPDAEAQVSISLVSLENEIGSNETFGCEDSLSSVQRTVDFTGDSEIEAALIELFNTQSMITTDKGDELYNALSQSNLAVDRIEETNGRVSVYLEGQLQLGGVCDNPRVEEQLTTTVENNTTANNIQIFINNETLEDALSQQ